MYQLFSDHIIWLRACSFLYSKCDSSCTNYCSFGHDYIQFPQKLNWLNVQKDFTARHSLDRLMDVTLLERFFFQTCEDLSTKTCKDRYQRWLNNQRVIYFVSSYSELKTCRENLSCEIVIHPPQVYILYRYGAANVGKQWSSQKS